jgi:arylsulfatase A-like enzyme
VTARPNILLITSDQQRGDCFGFEGRGVRTPHLDQLATDGTRFSACITPNVICQPARASLLTGLLPLTHGVHDNGIDLDPGLGEQGFAGQLAAAGYDTAFVGKAHFSTVFTFERTGTPEDLQSSNDYPADWSGPYMGFEHVELVTLGHPLPPMQPPWGHHYERWYAADGRYEERNRAYKTEVLPGVGAPQTWHSGLPVAWHTSSWTADRTIDYLRRERERPFCLWVSFPDPHHPFDAPVPWSLLHHPDEVDLPVHRSRDLDRRPWWHRASLESTPAADADVQAIRASFSRTPELTEQQLRHVIANYYGMISLLDHNVGRILVELDQQGLARDTLVVFTSDHGDWLGDHGLLLKGPMHYEGLLRVGLLARGPGVPSGAVVADPVSTVDLAATFSDYAGGAATTAHGRSLRPFLEGRAATRDFALNEWKLHPTRTGVALDLRTVRTRTHKLTLDLTSAAGELYDLSTDPHELENRFSDPGLAGVRRDLEDMLRSRPADVVDPLPVPVGMS